MPVQINLKDPIHGISLSSCRPGEMAQISHQGFLSSEDGDDFIRVLEGLASHLVNQLPEQNRMLLSTIDHLVAILHPDLSVDIYINEVVFSVEIRSKNNVNAGDPIYIDDIADVHSLKLNNITIPDNAGILLLFSVGWRKGLYYDFSPLLPNATPRPYALENLFGQYYAYLTFQHMFKFSDQEWVAFFAQQWFPFISLSLETLKTIRNHVNSGWEIDELNDKIADELKHKLNSWLEKWRANPVFAEHLPFLESAVDRYLANDYMSVTAILFPRIEGVMRSHFLSKGVSGNMTQKSLTTSAVDPQLYTDRPYSPLLPERFSQYLSEVYFAKFDPVGDKPLSRNSVSHGVAAASDFNVKSASLAFLVLDQLSFYLQVLENH